MRPNHQNRRVRGRSSNPGNRKGPNPLTRSYESNGPDVKVRGTPQMVVEKYVQLARDAQASGDPVASENYLQHAEHYFRIISAAQAQLHSQSLGLPNPALGEDGEDAFDEEDDVDQAPYAFATSSQRTNGSSNGAAPVGEPTTGSGPQPFPERPFRSEENDRSFQDRPQQDRSSQDRSSQDRPPQDRSAQDRRPRFDRPNSERPPEKNPRFARPQNGERPQNRYERQERDRPQGDRFERPAREGRDASGYDRRPRRDGAPPQASDLRTDGRAFAEQDQGVSTPEISEPVSEKRFDKPRERFAREDRHRPREEEAQAGEATLPAFLTAPVRSPPPAEPVVEASAPAPAPSSVESSDADTSAPPKRGRGRPKRPAAGSPKDETAS